MVHGAPHGGRGPVWSIYSSCAGIVLEQAAEPFSTYDRRAPAIGLPCGWEQQDVSLRLIMPLGVVMRSEFGQSAFHRGLPEEDQPGQAFFFHRSHPSLGEGVQVGRTRREFERVYASCLQQRIE